MFRLAVLPILGLLVASSLATAANVVVVCPPAWRPAMAPWQALRQSQGHSLSFVAPQATFQLTRDAIQRAVSDFHASIAQGASSDLAQFVVLVGDAAGEAEGASGKQVPTSFAPARINRRWGSEPTLSTDYLYGDTNGDGKIDAAVGRIPADSPAELRAYLQRVIRFEQAHLEPRQTGLSDDPRLTVVAAPGNFSPLLDRVIETTAVGIFHQLTPPECDLHVTYADWRSPYCPYPPRMSQAVQASLGRRSLAWIYLGHGLRHEVDVLRTPLGHARILNQEFARALDGEQFPPIAVLVACYTGAFDGSDDCLAETMLAAPGGPLVVLAGSRVTMPYGNSVLGLELLRSLFQGGETTVGGMVAAAKARAADPAPPGVGLRNTVEAIAAMVTPDEKDRVQERQEHLRMYNLLGDPLVGVRRPVPLTLTAQQSGDAPGRTIITGRSPIDGVCQVRLVRPRRAQTVQGKRQALELTPAASQEFSHSYSAANNRTLARQAITVQRGPFEATLQLPTGAKEQDIEVVATVTGPGGVAAGHTVVK